MKKANEIMPVTAPKDRKNGTESTPADRFTMATPRISFLLVIDSTSPQGFEPWT